MYTYVVLNDWKVGTLESSMTNQSHHSNLP